MNLFTPDLGLIFWQTIVLALLLFVLRVYGWEQILKVIEKEERKHAQAIKSAHTARLTTKRLEKISESIVSTAREKEASILKRATATQLAMIEEAKEKAQLLQEEMLEKAQKRITKEEDLALQQLKSEVSTLVLETTTKLLKRELSQPKEQQAYIQTMLSKQKAFTQA